MMLRWLPRILPFVLFLPLAFHFFETFPNGWDPAEYVWCVKAGYLPHSPYVLFVFLGRLLHVVFPAATALSLLSLLGGLAALAALSALVSAVSAVSVVRLTGMVEADSARRVWRGALAACLLAGSTVFVRQATTQEVYGLQLGLVLVAVWVVVRGGPHRLVWGGLVFGCALGVHNASVFLLPALAWLVGSRLARVGPPGRSLAIWGASMAGTLAAIYAVVAVLLPAEPGARLVELLVYLRGLAPGLDAAALATPGHITSSASALFERLVDGSIEVARGPQATGPVGVSVLMLSASVLGSVLLWRRDRTLALFWALWCGPFLAYELGLGRNLDYGTYAVFVLPPLCAWAAEAAAFPIRHGSRWGPVAAAAGMAALLVVPLAQLGVQWRSVDVDRRRHDSATTLAARWAAESLPAEAVVIQPRSEGNVNLMPLYAERLTVVRSGGALRILAESRPWTPMRHDSYEILTTERLEKLLQSGRPVYAFGPNPLAGAVAIDASAFVWKSVASIDLGDLARRLGVFEPQRFAGRSLTAYSGTSSLPAPGRSR